MNMKLINATYCIIALCVLAFLLVNITGIISDNTLALFYWQSPLFNAKQLLSYLFVHAGAAHLLLNMIGLFVFGLAIERACGWWRFVLLYVVCGVGAGFIYQLVNYYEFQQAIAPLLVAGIDNQALLNVFNSNSYYPGFPSSKQAASIFLSPLVGASGAIYGVLTAFAVLFPNHKIFLIFLPIPIAAKFFVPVLLGLDLLSGVTGFSIFGSQIAHSAHIGGAIMSLLVIPFLIKAKAS